MKNTIRIMVREPFGEFRIIRRATTLQEAQEIGRQLRQEIMDRWNAGPRWEPEILADGTSFIGEIKAFRPAGG